MLEGWEWIGLGVVLLVIFLWGPSKIPELARALGRAKGEFDKASREFTEAATTPAPASARKDDDIILETAKKLGVETEGRSKAQISAEIAERIQEIGGS